MRGAAPPLDPRDAVIVGFAAWVSWGHAVWAASSAVPTEAASGPYVAALAVASALHGNDAVLADAFAAPSAWSVVPLWMGLWLAVLGKSYTVAVASLLPFHGLAAWGLWRGGSALGGPRGALGGAWALVAGLGAAGALAYGGGTALAFPVFACVAAVAAAALADRPGRALGGVAASVFVSPLALGALAGVALDLVVGRLRGRGPNAWRLAIVAAAIGVYGGAALVPDTVDRAGGFARGMAGLATLGGPAALGSVVLALLTRGDIVTIRVLAWIGAAVAGGALAGSADGSALAVVPLLVIAGAGTAAAPLALGGLATLAVAQIVGFHTDRVGWPGRPAALRPVASAPYDVAPALDWLAARAPAGVGRVGLALDGDDGLHAGLVRARALERGDALTFVVIDDRHPLVAPTDLAVRIAATGSTPDRRGWRAQLPPATERWEGPGAYVVELWDRGLPPEDLLATPADAETRNHPSRQGLWAYSDGAEHGPLIAHASSAEIVVTAEGVEALFVRQQAIWRARSADGLVFDEARPLLDAAGGAIAAFDPAVVALDGGEVRLYAAELVGDNRHVDPASHPTRVVSWRGRSLDTLVREAGVRYEGLGVVDPSVIELDGAWEMYLTEARSRLVRARSADGMTFVRDPDPGFSVDGYTVPHVATDALYAQTQVMGWAVLQRAPRTAGAVGPFATLELCGTGATLAAGRLYYTRADEPCPEPVVLPARRGGLDAITRTAALPVAGAP